MNLVNRSNEIKNKLALMRANRVSLKGNFEITAEEALNIAAEQFITIAKSFKAINKMQQAAHFEKMADTMLKTIERCKAKWSIY